jgi:hypothetical protein
MLDLDKRFNRKLALIKQIISLAVLVILVLLVLRWCENEDPNARFEIEESPIKIEMVKSIAQLASISYKDEVVVDTVEYYRNQGEQIAGNIEKIMDVDNFKYGIKASNVKRRLTLIVKGKVLIGFNLKDKKFKIQQLDSSILISLPEPKILDILSTPSSTKIFHENGKWEDHEITALKNKARRKMTESVKQLNLINKAKENIKTVLTKLIKKQKVKIDFEFK